MLNQNNANVSNSDINLPSYEELSAALNQVEAFISSMRNASVLINSFDSEGLDLNGADSEVACIKENFQILIDGESEINKIRQSLKDILYLLYQVEDYNNDPDIATAKMYMTNVLYGFGKFGESLIDGGAYLFSLYSASDLMTQAYDAKIKGDEALYEYLLESKESFEHTSAAWIAVDRVGNARTSFFENSVSGRDINANSAYSYDSEKMTNVYNESATVARVATEAVTSKIPVVGKAVSGTIGGLSYMGTTAEKIFSANDNPTITDGEKEILSSSIPGITEGIAVANATDAASNVATVIKNIATPNGMWNTATSQVNNVVNSAKSYATFNQLASAVGKATGKAVIGSVLDPDNAIQVINSTRQAKQEGDLTFQNFANDVFNEYKYDIGTNLLEHVAPGMSSILEAHDALSDSGLYCDLDTKRNG